MKNIVRGNGMMPWRQLILRYALFALIAIIVNLGAQRIIFSLGDTAIYYAAAIIIGTAAGLVVKYVLDKKWIFYDDRSGAKEIGRQFSAYTVMGIVTTFIFWGVETLAWMLTQDHSAREVGAVIGLSIGYFVKYLLDRKFVFK